MRRTCGACRRSCLLTRPVIVGWLVSLVDSTVIDCGLPEIPVVRYVLSNCLFYPMADHSLANTSCATDSSQATGSRTSSVSLSGFANRTLSSETSATAMVRFSLDLRDLEAASALGALGVVPKTQWPSAEATMHELSTDSEVTFRK